MQRHPEITRRRIERFASEAQLRGRVYPRRAPVTLSVYSAPGRIGYDEAMRGDYRPARVGEQFGPVWSTHWFRVEIATPPEWRGAEVHLLWDSSSEACVWQDGVPLQGLTGTDDTRRENRKQFDLTPRAAGGERQTLYIEVACNGLFGLDDLRAPTALGLLRQAEIAVFDRDAWDLLWDFVIVADMARHLPPDTPRAGQALFAANAMVNTCDLDDRATWPAARAIVREFLAVRNGGGQHNLSAIGHAHIDTAWLWPLAETRRKCYRSFATAVRYLDSYPDYVFACSQAQQWAWMKESQPLLYARMRELARANRFVPAGGTWVEPDCNIPAGESLVRQFLYGQRFFRQELGIPCGEFWNPDVFGYSGALPQIMRGAGIRYFLTQKLSWNQFNKPASHTFLWEGIDGSRVLTHFPPADTYNAVADVEQVLYNVSNFKDHDRARESYMLFGHGDGGGGPTREMIERIRRMSDVDGLPRMQMRTPAEFFARCEADIHDPLVWAGELYFELHRGTYTTQARNKRNNRLSEARLHDAEMLNAIVAFQPGGDPAAYPAAELERLWKLVLLNQFHDIIPGSSIGEVYADSAAQYADILSSTERLRDDAFSALCGTAPTGSRIAVVNTLGMPRREVVELPVDMPTPQRAANGKPLAVVDAPSAGYAVIEPAAIGGLGELAAVRLDEQGDTVALENSFVRAVLRADGRLASLWHKPTGRETIATGAAGNNFVLFDDEPVQWEAWDVDVFHLEKRADLPPAATMQVLERGPLRTAVRFDYVLSEQSRLSQTVSLDAASARLDFDTHVEWRERHRFLKVEFPLDVRASEATYEIQFGHVRRPTHFNTTWDLARFEAPAQRWADLSEPAFGAALLNDCKYGYAAHGNVIRLSLLRGTQYPDPTADMGAHTFRYALYPHAGSPQGAKVADEAARFNVPLHLRATDAAPGSTSYFSLANRHCALVLDMVKRAEDSGALILRLYESSGSRGTARLTSILPVRRITRCNLLEDEEKELVWEGNGVTLDVRPFEIVTLKAER